MRACKKIEVLCNKLLGVSYSEANMYVHAAVSIMHCKLHFFETIIGRKELRVKLHQSRIKLIKASNVVVS
jgi:hypothetical protein